jgi:hypothetical protein
MNPVQKILNTFALSKEKQGVALADLLRVIEEFQNHLPPETSQVRRELKELATSTEATKKALNSLSPQALMMFCNAFDAPRGLALQQIAQLEQAALNSSMNAKELPNRVPDIARNILAGRVAIILDALGLPTSPTRDSDENITGERGGAAYARLLRATLEMAGDSPPDDLLPLLKTGLVIRDNPKGNICI